MKIPVTLLTGFLGSGKTTVLNHLIRNRSDKRIMVVENEVGQTNIDGTLVESGVEDIIELTAGCLCCSLSDGLLDALEIVSARKEEFDHLVIETTGLADPSSIIQVFLTDPLVSRYFDLQQVICVVDAGLIEDWLEETDEALRQIAMADVILINKMDTISEKYLSELEDKLHLINPFAVVFAGINGNFPFDEILQASIVDMSTFEKKQQSITHYQVDFNGNKLVKGQRHRANTFTLTFEKPFVLDDNFSLQLFRLVNLYRDQVYRIKGILQVEGYPNQAILQSVRTNCVISDGPPWKADEKKTSKLVFIGRGLTREAFLQMFNRFTQKTQYESY